MRLIFTVKYYPSLLIVKETRGGLLNRCIVNGRKITGYESVRLSDQSLVTISDSIDEITRYM